MSLMNWDPLDTQLSSELYSATIKRQIKNILKSYTGWYDPFCELIQNAIDAVEHRRQKDSKFEPTIWIQIDLEKSIISVTDNGIGFSEDQFKSFLAPNVSFKKLGDRGNKGVGATYLGYGFNYLQIGTRTTDFSFVGTLKDGREWVEDEGGIKTRPKMQESTVIHDMFNEVDQGTTFSLKLEGDYIRPRDLSWLQATNAEQWAMVLRLKTPLGGIYFTRDKFLSRSHLKVIDEQGAVTEKTLDDCQYAYPHTVIPTCQSLKDIRKVQQDLIAKGKDGSRLPDRYYRVNGLYNSWSHSDLLDVKGEFHGLFSKEEKDLLQKHKVFVYAFFGYSTSIWDRFNDDTVGLRKGTRSLLKGGIQLATNGMPQGELLIIPLTKNTGYQNVTHIVVHFDEAEPDLGRKGFQPELHLLSQGLAVSIVKKFLGWRQLLKKETGAPPDIIGEKNIYDWIKAQEQHEQSNPLVIRRKDVFLPVMEPSITSTPLNEQDVIALFNQLLAGGVIRGVKVMSTSQHQQYDGIYKFCLQKPFENHIFEKEKNPLGIESSRVTDEFVSAPGILEYKYSFDALLEEIEKEEKKEREIKLVVAWELGNNWPKRYEVTPLLYFENLHHRYFHGGTHIIKDASTGDTVFPAIILSELIEYINNPDAVQDYQKEKYIEV